ncbi:MAG: hypothetical protein ACD_9C00003G0002 [uncultured bacterium]|nr:MAG: hypothetical protein ACD_9C00003G0002 [uncultured bacterium]
MYFEYPADLAKRIKEEYPLNEEGRLEENRNIHRILDNSIVEGGEDWLTTWLQHEYNVNFNLKFSYPKAIIKAFEEGREQDILAAARTAVRRIQIYKECDELLDSLKK